MTFKLEKYRDQRYAARIAAVGFAVLSVMLGFIYDKTDFVAPVVYFVLYGLILLAVTSDVFIHFLKVKPAEKLMDEMNTRLAKYVRFHGSRIIGE
ncbi:MAG TPA: hypothetical protein VGO98_02645 [Candidatus Saccharimonadales bacterium]|jgi:hypothetical protein|nr:hypothetical protein [Candidatus Saccharimonadales bacterium]